MTLEFKRSTAELQRAGEALFAFLGGESRKVLTGVGPDRWLVGQGVADITLCDIATAPLGARLGARARAAGVDRAAGGAAVAGLKLAGLPIAARTV